MDDVDAGVAVREALNAGLLAWAQRWNVVVTPKMQVEIATAQVAALAPVLAAQRQALADAERRTEGARGDERERCAQIALEQDDDGGNIWPDGYEIAEAIRESGFEHDRALATPAPATGTRAEGRKEAFMELADMLEQEADAHVHEHWSYDGSTGAWEPPNTAHEEWESGQRELIERIRTLAQAPS